MCSTCRKEGTVGKLLSRMDPARGASPATLPDAYKKKVRGTKKNRQHPNQPHYNISKGDQHAAYIVYSGDRVLRK